jgi:CheY-like chemotaxis protein
MNKELMTVLIVDDDKDDGLWLQEVVSQIFPACTCSFERDGIAALRYIKNNPAPDLVFLDLNMPIKNGLDCLRDIYNLNLLPNTPTIIYSTSTNIKDIDQAYKYGALCYFVKPTSAEQLKNFIKQGLSIAGKANHQRVDKSNFVLMEGPMKGENH